MDQNPDGNYAPYPKRDLPLELIFEIRDEMAERLKR